MVTERQYEATYDTGRDYGTFYFRSIHRAGSKANLEDAKSAMISKYGWHSRNYEIVRIYRSDDC